MILINAGTGTLEIPIIIQPGADNNTISIELGFGRKVVGTVGTGVGFDAGVLMSKNGGESSWIIEAKSVLKRGGSYELAATMEHHLYDNELTKDIAKKRKIIQEGTVEEYKNNNNFLNNEHEENKISLYNGHPYPGVKWGMVVDLNKCIGCGDCVVACNAENNIPIVGKDQVLVGREMQWLRVDRYYSGDVDDPAISNQIMLCQQCDNAPCENVCPVAATTHSPDGLNQMVYNRCVGTRYCSNNCPYKVRRFNYFNYRDHYNNSYQQSNLLSLVYNPEVTVRSRGVMEKCTFCIQRIMDARSNAIEEHIQFKGSAVKTACQEACNTNAIKFGDSNDKTSEIYKLRTHDLAYYVLEDVNTRPNVTYLAKLRNTDTEVS
jgi:molybdopterin-containing oxidoreductase family iron-sulfur binding subunit